MDQMSKILGNVGGPTLQHRDPRRSEGPRHDVAERRKWPGSGSLRCSGAVAKLLFIA